MIEAAFKILLIENVKNFADLVCDALVFDETVPEYDVFVVSGTKDALDLLEGREIDLVLLGVSLAKPDSLGIVKLLRARSQDIPIVILTQEHDRAFAAQAMQAGARDCLSGEEVIAPLLRRVARYAIERYRIQRRLEELRTKKEREVEMAKLGTLCGPSTLSTTLKSLSSAPLAEARPKEFKAEIEKYVVLLDRLLNANSADEKSALTEETHGLADRLGALNTGPRDLVEIHKAALSQKFGSRFITDTDASIEEGRLLLLQLMGHLVSYYRRLSWGRRPITVKSHEPHRQTASRRSGEE